MFEKKPTLFVREDQIVEGLTPWWFYPTIGLCYGIYMLATMA